MRSGRDYGVGHALKRKALGQRRAGIDRDPHPKLASVCEEIEVKRRQLPQVHAVIALLEQHSGLVLAPLKRAPRRRVVQLKRHIVRARQRSAAGVKQAPLVSELDGDR